MKIQDFITKLVASIALAAFFLAYPFIKGLEIYNLWPFLIMTIIVIFCLDWWIWNKWLIKKLSEAFVFIWKNISPYFSKTVRSRDFKLIQTIADSCADYKILKNEDYEVIMETMDHAGTPLMRWEISRDYMYTDKSRQLRVSCQYLTGEYLIPYISRFDCRANPLMVYTTMLQGLNNAKMEGLNKGKA